MIDEQAEKSIRAFIDKKIRSRDFKIDDFEISEKLNIPIEQVDKVIKKLLKEGTLYYPVSRIPPVFKRWMNRHAVFSVNYLNFCF